MGNCITCINLIKYRDSIDLTKFNAENTPWLSLKGEKLQCKVIDVYDGDTITVIIPWNKSVYKKKCRLVGIDSPEIRTKDLNEKTAAYISKEFLKGIIENKIVWIDCDDWDKYGRLLIVIYINKVDIGNYEKSVNKLMIEKNLAYSYDGGTKSAFKTWHK